MHRLQLVDSLPQISPYNFHPELFDKITGGAQVNAIVLDFSKALNKISHSRFMSKLDFYGIRSGTHNWVEAVINDRQQRVVLDDCLSSTVPVLSGVLQDTVLRPTLFFIVINDLPQCVNSSVLTFADDCVLYCEIHNDQDAIILQNNLRAINHWEQQWLMEFNADKCFQN